MMSIKCRIKGVPIEKQVKMHNNTTYSVTIRAMKMNFEKVEIGLLSSRASYGTLTGRLLYGSRFVTSTGSHTNTNAEETI